MAHLHWHAIGAASIAKVPSAISWKGAAGTGIMGMAAGQAAAAAGVIGAGPPLAN